MTRKKVSCPPARARKFELHGDTRVDDYYWLRERENPEVISYLQEENEHVRDVMAGTAEFEECLVEEIKSRIKQTDISVPYRDGPYRYYRRTEDDKDYKIYCRQPVGVSGEEQVILDVNEIAESAAFCDVGACSVSPSGSLLAYAVDKVGRREYIARFRDLVSGVDLKDVVTDVTSNLVWASDSETVFYARHDPITLRPNRIYRHRLGTDPETDVLVYEETDDTFSCAVGRSRSKQFIFIASYQTLTSEYRYLDAKTPEGLFTVFLSRERGHEYELDHFQNRFFVRTNQEATNFRLMATDDSHPERDNWQNVIDHRDDVLLEGFETFRDYLVLEERCHGLSQLRVKPWNDEPEHQIRFDESAYEVYVETNREPDTNILRFGFSSMATPTSIYDYDMLKRTRVLLKQDEVLGGFDSTNYETERIFATTVDGVRVPVSLVRRRDTRIDGTAPLLLYGYGSYGISMDPTFRSSRLSLLDRGFIFAIAHIRGGQELGRRWYDDGKLFKKKNSFTDFVACAECVVDQGFTSPERLFAMGGSAGGLLMAAVINMRPELFHGVVAQVPFVDVLTTMLDEDIPLTTGEYDEWGNPNDPEYYRYIRSYSPYDNMEPVTWPHLLVMTGLHDSQVQYWEPAKWVAKRRAMVTDDRRLLLKTNMDAGHGGASGRTNQYREVALQYTFLLDLAGRLGPLK